MAQIDKGKSDQGHSTLGEELRNVRTLHGFKLIDVERETGISNAYLSQLEKGKIEKPSPDKLYLLAEMYKISYEALMEKAGYIVKKVETEKPHRTLTGAALSSLENLTPAEETALAEYLAFLRSRKQRG